MSRKERSGRCSRLSIRRKSCCAPMLYFARKSLRTCGARLPEKIEDLRHYDVQGDGQSRWLF